MEEKLLEVRHLKKYFHTPAGLLHAVDDVDFSIPKLTDEDHTHLAVIKGMVPSFDQMPKGCAFCPRCAEARDICRERMPELTEVDGQKVRCFKYSKEWEDAR